MNDLNLLLAGVPGTGKTSYLALLYYAVLEEENSELRITDFGEDREYLNEILTALQEGRQADHTSVGGDNGMDIGVQFTGGAEGRLRVPDLSGETWQGALEDRVWTASLDQQVRDSTGICLFINVGDFHGDPTIIDATRVTHAMGFDEDGPTPPTSGNSRPILSSSQVQAVDLLQLLTRNRTRQSRRVSVVLSAFDRAAGVTPIRWMKESAPLLHQYLQVNDALIESRVFGVSAQGGRFDLENDREALVEQAVLERAFIQREQGDKAAFDEPITWLLGSLNA